jgi:hypothetical protein
MISIITSLYNSNTHLKKYIKHIEKFSMKLSQNKIEYEFIIIPNSPNDFEKNKLKEIENNINIKSRIIVCERESLYATWNRGIGQAKYENITFWNVDDMRFANAVCDGLSKMNKGVDVVYFPFIYKRYIKILGLKILAKIKIVKPFNFKKELFTKGMYLGPFFMAKKSCFDKIGGFDESFKISGDFDWAVRAAKADLVFEKSDKLGGIFTNDGTTLSGSKNNLHKIENDRILA